MTYIYDENILITEDALKSIVRDACDVLVYRDSTPMLANAKCNRDDCHLTQLSLLRRLTYILPFRSVEDHLESSLLFK